MGAITFSLDTRLVKTLNSAIPLSTFVETGTFKGDTVADLLQHFDRIITIEFSEQLWQAAFTRFKNTNKVEVLLGNSPQVLRDIRSDIGDVPTLFWLDAHWCVAQNTVGNQSQCPLLDEISAIDHLNDSSIVLIDDARLFLAPPPEPHDITQWPSLDQILIALRTLSNQHELMVINDVIAFYPKHARDSIIEYARKYGVDWLAVSPYFDPKNNLIASLNEKEHVIQSQHALLQSQAKELENKKHLIEELQVTIASCRIILFFLNPLFRPFKSPARALYRLLRPRLGDLYQHPPHELVVPTHYAQTTIPAITPKISIVTPSFKQARFIERTIKSVLSQSYPDLEYFIQDGGSNDGTREILQRYDHLLTGWESFPDNGQSQALNIGLAKTTGEIMGWINSDDILLPGALAYISHYFNQHPEVDVIYGHRILIDERDLQIGRWMMPGHNDEVLSWVDYIPQETMFWRRSIWEKSGGKIDESFRFAMDWDLILRFRNVGARFVRVPRFIGAFRVHVEQKTTVDLAETGYQEMNRLRQRELGRVPSAQEVHEATSFYLIKHVAITLIWRALDKIKSFV